MGTWPARLRRLMKHAHVIAVAAALLLAGCTSGEQSCPVGKTGGWFSGWGSGGSGAFTLGVRRPFGGCKDPSPAPAQPPADLGPAPSVDPASTPPASP